MFPPSPRATSLPRLINRSYTVETCLVHEWAGYGYEGHLRGLHEPAQAGFVEVAEGLSLTVPLTLLFSNRLS